MSSKKMITSLTIQSNRDVPIFVGVRKLLPGESFSISYTISHEFATALRYLYTKKMINITSGIETIQPVWDEIDRKAGKKPVNSEISHNTTEQNSESDKAVQAPEEETPVETPIETSVETPVETSKEETTVETPVETLEEKTEEKSKTKKSSRNK